MRAHFDVYEHPDFKPAPEDTTKASIMGAIIIVGTIGSIAVYRLVSTGKLVLSTECVPKFLLRSIVS